MNSFEDKSLKEWNIRDVKTWLISAGYQTEADLFGESQISGKSLQAMNREAMKDIGVESVGKQLEIMSLINDLKAKESAAQEQVTGAGAGAAAAVQSKWKKKIANSDKINWTAEQRALYNTKTALIIKNCRKLWPGNQKVLFKGNEKNLLKLEEMVTTLAGNCSIEEIGFGSEAIRNHIIQWGQGKNRRLSDGYDFEKEHKRAKRAKFTPWSHYSSSTTSTGSDDNDTDVGEQEGALSSNDIKDLSPFSAKIAILVAFKATSLSDISLKHHLIPLAKALKVKYRGKGKYDLITTLAPVLFTNNFLEPSDKQNCNYVHLKRHEIKLIMEIPTPPTTTPPATPSTTPPATPSTTPPATTPPVTPSSIPETEDEDEDEDEFEL